MVDCLYLRLHLLDHHVIFPESKYKRPAGHVTYHVITKIKKNQVEEWRYVAGF